VLKSELQPIGGEAVKEVNQNTGNVAFTQQQIEILEALDFRYFYALFPPPSSCLSEP